MNTELENKIISVAYGDADIFTKLKIRLLAYRNSEVKKLLDEYSRTAAKVKETKRDILEQIKLNNIKTPVPVSGNNSTPVFYYLFSKPLIPAAALIVALFITLLFILRKPRPEYTEAEIRLAEKQVKETIVLVGEVFEKTKYKLEKDILAERVGRPFFRTTKVLEKYIGGKQNEKLN